MLIGRLVHLRSRLLPTLLCVASVPVVTIILVRAFFAAPLSAFRPVLNDEVIYWHQAYTFARAGLHGGYYTLGEALNQSGFTPFGPHGPGFAVLYGVVGSLFGWPRHSVVVLNLIAIAGACWIWSSAARLTTARLWLSILFLATCWQVVFWAPTGMQESFHHAGAIVMAALFARALAMPPGAWLGAAGAVVLSVLSFVRPTWVLLMPLWALTVGRGLPRTRVIAAVTASLLLAGLILVAYGRSVAPFSGGFFFLRAASLSVGLQPLVANVTFNLSRTFSGADYDPLEILHRLQYWTFLAAAAALAVAAWRRRSAAAHFAIAATAMGVAIAGMLLLYTLTNWAEHRVLSAFLVFGVLLTLAAPGRAPVALVAALILSNLATAGTYLRVFEAKRLEQFVWDRRGVYQLQDALAGRVLYRPGQPRWCNTLLTAEAPPFLIAVPAGIGISIVREPDQMPHVPQSRYLLVSADALAQFPQPPRVEPLATLPYGTLYLNLDADCSDGARR